MKKSVQFSLQSNLARNVSIAFINANSVVRCRTWSGNCSGSDRDIEEFITSYRIGNEEVWRLMETSIG